MAHVVLWRAKSVCRWPHAVAELQPSPAPGAQHVGWPPHPRSQLLARHSHPRCKQAPRAGGVTHAAPPPPGLLVGVTDVRLDVGSVHKGQVNRLRDVAGGQHLGRLCRGREWWGGAWHTRSGGSPSEQANQRADARELTASAAQAAQRSTAAPTTAQCSKTQHSSTNRSTAQRTMTLGAALSWSSRVSSAFTARIASAGSLPTTAPLLQRVQERRSAGTGRQDSARAPCRAPAAAKACPLHIRPGMQAG